MEFENIFKNNVSEYINKILSKIQKIYDFDNVIKLINIKNIDDKDIFLNLLRKAYDKIIKSIEIKQKQEILARLAIVFFNCKNEKNKFKFIENKIKKLDKDIFPKNIY